MKSKEFIIWLKGFLTGKDELTVSEKALLDDELAKVDNTDIDYNDLVKRDIMPMPNMPTNPSLVPQPNSIDCHYPASCGLPTIWHGVVPPVCGKCGYQGLGMTITSSQTNPELTNIKMQYKEDE